ncbi:MAG: Jag N-terminal domain-containing protein [Elusimicrobia bacterium]|nr:Jag N-terminal domain-containing protein [Elusimicrobiota bacterium]
MKDWTGEGKTAEAAVARGLKKLGLTAEQVDVKVLGERASGLLSLFGFKRVKVRLVEKVRRSDRADRAEIPEREFRRTGPRGRRDERTREDKPPRSDENGRRGRSPEPRPEKRAPQRPEGRRHEPRPPVREERPERGRNPSRDRRGERPGPQSGPNPASRPPERIPEPPTEKNRDRSAPPPEASTRGSFHPSIPPESLLAQWRDLLGWEDLAWEFHPAENRRLPVDLKTSRGQTLAGSGGKVLEAFEYLFNLVSSGGDREKPWVSFRVAGFPSADESRLVDQALFAAFQVRRTGKMFRMDPMPPAHRRAVHQTLANHPDVETFSEGEGPLRLVVVKPKEKKE